MKASKKNIKKMIAGAYLDYYGEQPSDCFLDRATKELESVFNITIKETK